MGKRKKTRTVSPGHKHGRGQQCCVLILRKWEREKKEKVNQNIETQLQ